MLRRYKEARLREFPNREQAECYVQFGFESIESLKRFTKAKTPSSKYNIYFFVISCFNSY